MTHLSEYYNKMKEVGVRLKHQFLIDIPRLGADLKFFATTADLPGRTLEETEIPFHGFNMRIPTVTSFEGTMDINIRSDMGNELRTLCDIWQNDHANLAMGGGGKKRIPNEVAHLSLLDETLGNAYKNGTENVQQDICNEIAKGSTSINTTGCKNGAVLRQYTLVGVYPKSFAALGLDTTVADVAEFSLTLSYQYWYDRTGNTVRDPLGGGSNGS